MLIWLTGSDYGTLLTIASEMILVPYFLVGAFLLKNCQYVRYIKPWVSARAFMAYGYCMRPVLCICCCRWYFTLRVFWSFLYARRTHQHDRMLKRREMALIGFLLVAAVPATWMLVG